jgi:hypothetical protein
MMKSAIAILIVCLGASVALAGGTWTDKSEHRYSTGTSLKVMEPDGFKVTVTTADGDKVGTVPEVFPMPDADAFVKVTITAPDGTVWSKKIEIKSKHQTELVVTFKSDAPKAEPAKASKGYIGALQNRSGGCGSKWEGTIYAEFIAPNDRTVVAKSPNVDSQKNSNVELPAGAYDVRVYRWNGSEFQFSLTTRQTIPAQDGWALGWGCVQGTRTPTLVVQ